MSVRRRVLSLFLSIMFVFSILAPTTSFAAPVEPEPVLPTLFQDFDPPLSSVTDAGWSISNWGNATGNTWMDAANVGIEATNADDSSGGIGGGDGGNHGYLSLKSVGENNLTEDQKSKYYINIWDYQSPYRNGAEIAIPAFSVPANQLATQGYQQGYYECRMKSADWGQALQTDPRGNVSSFFIQGTQGGTFELDFEFLSNGLIGPTYPLADWLSSDDWGCVSVTLYSPGVTAETVYIYLPFNPAKEFHAYGFLWRTDRVDFVIDGQVVRSISGSFTCPGVRICMNHWTGDKWFGGWQPYEDSTAYYDYVAYYKDAEEIIGWPEYEGDAPTISGPVEMELTEGYAALSTDAFIIGDGCTVAQIKNPAPMVWDDDLHFYDDELIWNNTTKTIDIAPGLAPGDYRVLLRVDNGTLSSIIHSLTVTVNENVVADPSIPPGTPSYVMHFDTSDIPYFNINNAFPASADGRWEISGWAPWSAGNGAKVNIEAAVDGDESHGYMWNKTPAGNTHGAEIWTPSPNVSTQMYHYGYFETRLKVTGVGAGKQGVFFATELRTDGGHEIGFNFITNGDTGNWMGSDSSGVVSVRYPGGGTSINLDFNPSKAFHTYGMLWKADSLEFYIDGQLVHGASGNFAATSTRSYWHQDADNTWRDIQPPAQDAVSYYDYFAYYEGATAYPDGSAVAPGITGPAGMTLMEGYAATSSDAFSITGDAPVTVTKVSGDAAITWNDGEKKLDIAAGLAVGDYPVELQASNGVLPDATFTFTLSVKEFSAAQNIFTTQAPNSFTSDSPYELGTIFRADYDGIITGVRIYAGSSERGVHNVRIWRRSDRVVLAGPYAWDISQGPAGWRDYMFDTPLAILANTDYVVSVSTGADGSYPDAAGVHSAEIRNGYLTAPVGAGVFTTSLGQMPSSVWNNSGYFRDVFYEPSGVVTVPVSITGPERMTLTEGYAATSTGAYTITGEVPVTVEKTSGDAAITWNDGEKKLDIAAGLARGSYPVVLKASNGMTPDATLTFMLTVLAAPGEATEPDFEMHFDPVLPDWSGQLSGYPVSPDGLWVVSNWGPATGSNFMNSANVRIDAANPGDDSHGYLALKTVGKNNNPPDRGGAMGQNNGAEISAPDWDINTDDSPFKYGFFACRMKVADVGTASQTNPRGVCGSFFLQNTDGMEFDFEFLTNGLIGGSLPLYDWVHSENEGYVATALHPGNAVSYINLGFNPSKAFHEYGYLWLPDKIEWYVDGLLVRTETGDFTSGGIRIMMNNWTGDQWWGGYLPDEDATTYYDYVRYYEGATSYPGSGGGEPVVLNITGPNALTLTEGYTATSTDAYTITGEGVVTVTKDSGDAAITWNDGTKKLDIAAGLAAGSYTVVLKASNGADPDATFTFTLTVAPASSNAPTYIWHFDVEPGFPQANGNPTDYSPDGWWHFGATTSVFIRESSAGDDSHGYMELVNSGPQVFSPNYNEIATSQYKYGYYEFRMKFDGNGSLDRNEGLNVMFCLQGSTGTTFGSQGEGGFHLYTKDLRINCIDVGDRTMSFNPSEAFHTYGILWMPDKMELYADRQLIATSNRNYTSDTARIVINQYGGNDWNGYVPAGATYINYVDYLAYFEGATELPDWTDGGSGGGDELVAPTISGPTGMNLTVGYSAASSDTFTIGGDEPVSVTITSGDAAITWNDTTKKLDIAVGLTTGTYPVVLKASNGVDPDATFTFTLVVQAATINLSAINSANNFYQAYNAMLALVPFGLDIQDWIDMATLAEMGMIWDYEYPEYWETGFSDPLTTFDCIIIKAMIGASMCVERPLIGGYTSLAQVQAKYDELYDYYVNGGDLPEAIPGTPAEWDDDFFPIGVWLQTPSASNVSGYKDMGVNVMIGNGLNQNYLDTYKAYDMKTIAPLNTFARNNLASIGDTVLAWMHEDEPDNAQAMGMPESEYPQAGGGPAIQPRSIITLTNYWREIDPTRPIWINFSQGVSWLDWYGRGPDSKTQHKYPMYSEGADFLSYDIYPVNSGDAAVKNNLWMVADGIENLRAWSNDEKPTMMFIECTNYNGVGRPTPAQVKAEVWMTIVHGAKGIAYFCHQFVPSFIENGPLNSAYADINTALTAINFQIQDLARVLNSPTTTDYAEVESSNAAVPIDIMTKNYDDKNYIFAVGMRNGATTATFSVDYGDEVKVLGEDRIIAIVDGEFTDDFAAYGVHLYEITGLPQADLTAINNAWSFYDAKVALEDLAAFGLDLKNFNDMGTDAQLRSFTNYQNSNPTLFASLVAKYNIGQSIFWERPKIGYQSLEELQEKFDELYDYYVNGGAMPEAAPNTPWVNDEDFFPIAVWLQDPINAAGYKGIGVNTFVGLWDGLTQDALDAFHANDLKLICEMNEFALDHLDDDAIIAWMHSDEPDNAQDAGFSSTVWCPPIQPRTVITSYNMIKEQDPSRPVYINLGQGVSWINYVGRGIDSGKSWMYADYMKGADIVSYDIYPVNSTDTPVRNNLWMVADGIDNLRAWGNDEKPAWCWIECTNYNGGNGRTPTPLQTKAEVWMALVHGAKGVGYFCHQFSPTFIEAGPLSPTYADMKDMIVSINAQITELAPVLNSPTTSGYATVASSDAATPIDIMTKEYGESNYIFSVAMRNNPTTATFTVASGTDAIVLGEGRTIKIVDGEFTDDFAGYEVHLYEIIDTTPTISITGPATVVSGAGAEVRYTISAEKMPMVSAIDIEFEVDGDFLSSKEFNALDGFIFFSPGNYGTEFYWTNIGNKWIAKAILLNPVGASGEFDIVELVFNAAEGKLGPTDVILNNVAVSFGGATIEAVIDKGVATTVFEQYYSKYDLTHDGVIDLHDITYALQFLGIMIGDPEWAQAYVCDLDPNGVIDVSDLILILANYTESYYS